MKIILSLLQRVLVNHFYKINSGLFLFLFFVLFGLPYQPLSFHRALIEGILETQIFLLLVLAIWFLYTLKCIDYTTRQLKDPRQQFLFCLNNLSFRSRFLYMLFVHVLIYLPVILYAGAIIVVAIGHQSWLYIAEIIIANLLLVTGSALIYVKALSKEVVLPRIIQPRFRVNFRKRLFLIPLLHIWYTKKQMLLITKLFSLLFLWGFINLYEPSRYDTRPLQLCMLLCVSSHSAIVFQLRSFEDEYLSFARNLPIHSFVRFTSLTGSFIILLLPHYVFNPPQTLITCPVT